jgi:hypothetical protein
LVFRIFSPIEQGNFLIFRIEDYGIFVSLLKNLKFNEKVILKCKKIAVEKGIKE